MQFRLLFDRFCRELFDCFLRKIRSFTQGLKSRLSVECSSFFWQTGQKKEIRLSVSTDFQTQGGQLPHDPHQGNKSPAEIYSLPSVPGKSPAQDVKSTSARIESPRPGYTLFFLLYITDFKSLSAACPTGADSPPSYVPLPYVLGLAIHDPVPSPVP